MGGCGWVGVGVVGGGRGGVVEGPAARRRGRGTRLANAAVRRGWQSNDGVGGGRCRSWRVRAPRGAGRACKGGDDLWGYDSCASPSGARLVRDQEGGRGHWVPKKVGAGAKGPGTVSAGSRGSQRAACSCMVCFVGWPASIYVMASMNGGVPLSPGLSGSGSGARVGSDPGHPPFRHEARSKARPTSAAAAT